MTITLHNGTPVLEGTPISEYSGRVSLENTREKRCQWEANTLVTDQIKGDFPILRLTLKIEGEYHVTSGSPSLKEGGLFNLLKRFQLHIDGSKTRIDLRGVHLPYIHRMYNQFGNAPHVVEIDPDASGATKFFALVEIPIDLGGYFSPLDNHEGKTIDIHYHCGDWSDVVDDASNVVGNATCEVIPTRLTGAFPSERGGKGYPKYGKLHLKYTSTPIEQTSGDYMVADLLNDRSFIGLTMFAYDGNTLSDDVLKTIEMQKGNRIMHRWHGNEMQALGMGRFNLQTPWTGVYNLPFADRNHPEHAQRIRNDQTLRLMGDVEKGGGATRIEILTAYLQRD